MHICWNIYPKLNGRRYKKERRPQPIKVKAPLISQIQPFGAVRILYHTAPFSASKKKDDT